jgi:hypothetical protein
MEFAYCYTILIGDVYVNSIVDMGLFMTMNRLWPLPWRSVGIVFATFPE